MLSPFLALVLVAVGVLTADLPALDVLAAEITEDLRAALAQFEAVEAGLPS